MIQYVFYMLLTTTLGLGPVPHEFYVSVIEIQHEADQNQGTVFIKIFSDDLQNALQNAESMSAPPQIEELCGRYSSSVEEYLTGHTIIYLDGEPVSMTLHSCELVGETHQIVLGFDNKPWKSIKLEADFLMEIYPTQTQMVYVNNAGNKSTMRLTKRKTFGTMDFPN